LTSSSVSIDFPEKRNRWTTLLRAILAIPLLFYSIFYGIAAMIAVIIAWFALVITARYPDDLYDFVSGYVRFYIRIGAYILLFVDAYPPFNGDEAPDYPVQVSIPERQEKYSRLKAFFRFIYILPAVILTYVLMIALAILDVLAWICAVMFARVPGFIENYMRFAWGWVLKVQGLYCLLIENY
jgi:Domain of unknown function (DUF4389)